MSGWPWNWWDVERPESPPTPDGVYQLQQPQPAVPAGRSIVLYFDWPREQFASECRRHAEGMRRSVEGGG